MSTFIQISSGGGSGVFGISNSSGKYTYYATLTLAMAAATSGQTIEMFADVVETGAVILTLKDGVNINGNGHTYILNNSGLLNAFLTPTTAGVKISILNFHGIRTGSTGTVYDNSFIASFTAPSGLINCAGSTFTNLGSGCAIMSASGIEFINATATANTDFGSLGAFGSISVFTNCRAYSTTGFAIRLHTGGSIANNCYGFSNSGVGVYGGYYATISNCTGVSVSGTGIENFGDTSNSTGRSVSGNGYVQNGYGIGMNCTGISVSGAGILNYVSMANSTGLSSSSYGIRMGYGVTYNSTAKSISGPAMWNTNGNPQLYNVIAISEWNNVAAYGLRGNGGMFPNALINCTFILANASAPYLFNDGVAQAISLKGNTYKGGAVFNANLTQAITATQDNQGNIYL